MPSTRWDFDADTDAAAFSGLSRNAGYEIVQSTTYSRSGKKSAKPLGNHQSYMIKTDFGGNVIGAYAWFKIHVKKTVGSTIWFYSYQSGTPEYVAGGFSVYVGNYWAYNMGSQVGNLIVVDAWTKLGIIIDLPNQLVHYWQDGTKKASIAFFTTNCHNNNGICIETYGNYPADALSYYVDDFHVWHGTLSTLDDLCMRINIAWNDLVYPLPGVPFWTTDPRVSKWNRIERIQVSKSDSYDKKRERFRIYLENNVEAAIGALITILYGITFTGGGHVAITSIRKFRNLSAYQAIIEVDIL